MYYVHITQKFHKMERRNKRKLDISKNRMCRKWYPLETKDVNKEFLDDIESDREASNGDSTDNDSEDENVAEMDNEALYSSSSWRFFLYERNQFWTNLIIIVYIFLKFEWKYAKFKDKINSDYAAVTIYSHCPIGLICGSTIFIEPILLG